MSTVRTRVQRLERLKAARARRLEYWDQTEHADGLYTCPDHPGLELTEAEVDAHVEATNVDLVLIVYRDAQPAPGPW